MSIIGYIKEDFVKTYAKASKSSTKRMQLVFGDKVEIIEYKNKWTKLRSIDSYSNSVKYVSGKLELSQKGVLKISMVDVQQGDGMIVESPDGKVMFIDGGDNKLFARHAAARYQYKNTSKDQPMDVDAILVTHGDADHFDGLNEIVKSETNKTARKRLFIKPKRIFHNGLAKSPSKKNGVSIPDKKRFGRTKKVDDTLYAIDLFDDTRDADEDQLNTPFKNWHKSLEHWEEQNNTTIDCKRIAHGMDTTNIFDFLDEEDIKIELLGPFTRKVSYWNKMYDALPFLNKHSDESMIHIDSDKELKELSASHTINGHSIAFRMVYGNVRILFTGDLNKESLDIMMNNVTDPKALECEIFKAPHHGSHDFAVKALKKASPIISIISSGDESSFHEHIHPRATLLAALGNNSRTDMSIILSTELAAFFTKKDLCYTRDTLADFFKNSTQQNYTSEELRKLFSGVHRKEDPKGLFYGFQRTNFGIIHIRTDGKRILAFTHSGKKGMNEAYSYTIAADHSVTSNKIKKR
ncbi:MBL fold metallo-hydrolase [uncultured Psychroserpens sp.]|uniref:ComEC/Rec2 family competence protein n=1 Tax=uncultured Psychroserpens sp. TaxID=255436 RepID=UPI00262FA79D|nr:MBL fold metallo-hydrolase [uncultured Psychroserpens sp.]